jgi:hypothetical protein
MWRLLTRTAGGAVGGVFVELFIRRWVRVSELPVLELEFLPGIGGELL